MSKKVDRKGANAPRIPQFSLLDTTFPLWNEASFPPEKETTEKFEDPHGFLLPTAARPFLDTWKRPDDLVNNNPNVPVVTFKINSEVKEIKEGKGSKGSILANREVEGTLYAGHTSFEWMLWIFTTVMASQKHLKPGDYLWELIYPKDKEGSIIKSPAGKYRIRLFVMDAWRTVTVDDRIPIDLFGRPLLIGMTPIQLWPLLLSKALIKVMGSMHLLDMELPHQAAAFSALTGWPQEDLLDQLSGTPYAGGRLLDRLEEAVGGEEPLSDPGHVVPTACIIQRTIPERHPPRIIVLFGPSATGVSKILRCLVTEFPDKFGMTVSHTTRRPRAHEVEGQDYFFTTKRALLNEVQEGKFLESSSVASVGGTYLYGTSLATVREVAATGKICVMSTDMQGVAGLVANKRIDGLYVLVKPPSMVELERRLRSRLKEADSTIQKRITWATDQLSKAKVRDLYDHVVDNVDDFDAVYYEIKEAISTLSPIIRNRLRGLPAYVLDYADLIPPNLVEKPFLKPVIISGPHTGERQKLMEQLVQEFPDVFAFPYVHTTRPADEEAQHRVDVEEPKEEAVPGEEERPATAAARPSVCVANEEFDQLLSDKRLLAHYSDMFMHPTTTYRYGISITAVKEVITSGRIPLLGLECEGLTELKVGSGIDCLGIFLQPPSLEVYQQRLETWLTETDEEIQARLQKAEQQIQEAIDKGLFDIQLVNENLEDTYTQLRQHISKVRPDVIKPDDEDETPAALSPTDKQMVLALVGPALAGREKLTETLVRIMPTKLGLPQLITDRRPGKGETSTDTLLFTSSKEMQKMMAESQVLYVKTADGGQTVLTEAAVEAVTSSGRIAIIGLDDIAAANAVRDQALAKAVYVYVASKGMMIAATAEAAPPPTPGTPKAAVAGKKGNRPLTPLMPSEAMLNSLEEGANEARTSGLYDSVLTHDEQMDLVIELRGMISEIFPKLVPGIYRPVVVAGPFGSGKRALLQRLFDSLPGLMASPSLSTTKPTGEGSPDPRTEMMVFDRDRMQADIAAGAYLTHNETMGHLYGLSKVSVKKVQASGKLCIIDVDHVRDVVAMRQRGLDALYMFVGIKDMDQLRAKVEAEVDANPPLGYDRDQAVELMFQAARMEVESSEEEGLFDDWILHTPEDTDASFGCLSESLHLRYPDIVPLNFVWGFGRALWDAAVREHGRKPLKVMVLGPAAVGKTALCEALAARFSLPHINVGDLLYNEVQKKTALGLEAKVFMDQSKTVPDRFFLEILKAKLATRECQLSGWLLDGFPHTASQAAELASEGIVADKVFVLECDHNLLLDRIRYRRIDPVSGKTYRMPEITNSRSTPDGHSRPKTPPTNNKYIDPEVVKRLVPRHDDTDDNVNVRLKLWDEHCTALRAVFESVSLRLNGTATTTNNTELAAMFITLEDRVPEINIVPSNSLKELQYMIISTLRYRRKQLLKLALYASDKTYWVEACDLASNSFCILLHHDPGAYTNTHQLRRVDLYSIPKPALLHIDSPEPVRILVSLFGGMQYQMEAGHEDPRRLLFLSGPPAVGKKKLADLLLSDHGDKMARIIPLTTRPPYKGEESAGRYEFIGGKDFAALAASKEVVAVVEVNGVSYGVRSADLEAVWKSGKMPLINGPVDMVAEITKATNATVVAVYLTADTDVLDQQMRQQDMLTEYQIQEQLQLAAREVSRISVVALPINLEPAPTPPTPPTPAQKAATPRAVSRPPTRTGGSQTFQNVGGPQVHLMLHGDSRDRSYAQVKEIASRMWARPRRHASVEVMLEEYEWRRAAPGDTRVRIKAAMANSMRLDLPRGKTLLRIVGSPEYLHALTFYSTSTFVAGEFKSVLPTADPSAHITSFEGEHPALPRGHACVFFRYNMRLSKVTTLSLTMISSNEAVRSCARLVLVDNDKGTEQSFLLGASPPMTLEPNTNGYCILAAADMVRPSEEGSWHLMVMSSEQLKSIEPTPVDRSITYSGTYSANTRTILARYLASATQAQQVSMVVALYPPLPARLTMQFIPVGREAQWTVEDYKLVGEREIPSGYELIPNINLPQGKHLFQLALRPALCPADAQPNSTTGALPVPLSFRIVFMPSSSDDRLCMITADDSQQRYFRSMLDTWAGMSGAAAAAASAKGGKPPVATGGMRSLTAMALLEKFSTQTTVEGPPSRTLKDGSTLELQPQKCVRVVGGGSEAALVPAEKVEERTARCIEEARRAPELAEKVAAVKEANKQARQALQAAKVSKYTEWRNQMLASQRDILDKRVEVAAAGNGV